MSELPPSLDVLRALFQDVTVTVALEAGTGYNATEDWWTASIEELSLTATSRGVEVAILALAGQVRERLADPSWLDVSIAQRRVLAYLFLAESEGALPRLLADSSEHRGATAEPDKRSLSVAEVLERVGARPTPLRISMLEALEPLYVANGVLHNGYAPSLQRCCVSRETCWAGTLDRRQEEFVLDPRIGEHASLPWPWIGERYEPGGVCMISQNLNMEDGGAGSLGVEYQLSADVERALGQGDKTPYGSSNFHWRMLSTAGAVLSSLDGEEPSSELTDTDEALATLARITRIQAIKCSPLGDRSSPTAAMVKQCPPRFSPTELGVLKPRVVVALGNPAFDALSSLGAAWSETSEHFWRGEMTLGEPVTTLWLYHPTSRGGLWTASQRALVASLRAKPLAIYGVDAEQAG